jgi:hypothetical protein
MDGYVARMEEMRNGYRILVGTQEKKKELARSRSRWDDDNRMYLREIGCEGVDWIHLAQDKDQRRAFVNTAMKFRVS